MEVLRLIGFLQNFHRRNFNWLRRLHLQTKRPACVKDG